MSHGIRLSKKYKLFYYKAAKDAFNKKLSRWQVLYFAYSSRYNCYLRNRDSYSLDKLDNTLHCLTYLGDITDQARILSLYAKQEYQEELAVI